MGYVNTDELYENLKHGKISMDDFMDAIVNLDQNGGKGIMSFQEQARSATDGIGTAFANMKNRLKARICKYIRGFRRNGKRNKIQKHCWYN